MPVVFRRAVIVSENLHESTHQIPPKSPHWLESQYHSDGRGNHSPKPIFFRRRTSSASHPWNKTR